MYSNLLLNLFSYPRSVCLPLKATATVAATSLLDATRYINTYPLIAIN